MVMHLHTKESSVEIKELILYPDPEHDLVKTVDNLYFMSSEMICVQVFDENNKLVVQHKVMHYNPDIS